MSDSQNTNSDVNSQQDPAERPERPEIDRSHQERFEPPKSEREGTTGEDGGEKSKRTGDS